MPAPITTEQARKVASIALAEARANNWTMAAAVVDPAGILVYFEKIDDTQHASPQIAIDKARSAALFKRPTKTFQGSGCQGRSEPGLGGAGGGRAQAAQRRREVVPDGRGDPRPGPGRGAGGSGRGSGQEAGQGERHGDRQGAGHGPTWCPHLPSSRHVEATWFQIVPWALAPEGSRSCHSPLRARLVAVQVRQQDLGLGFRRRLQESTAEKLRRGGTRGR